MSGTAKRPRPERSVVTAMGSGDLKGAGHRMDGGVDPPKRLHCGQHVHDCVRVEKGGGYTVRVDGTVALTWAGLAGSTAMPAIDHHGRPDDRVDEAWRDNTLRALTHHARRRQNRRR